MRRPQSRVLKGALRREELPFGLVERLLVGPLSPDAVEFDEDAPAPQGEVAEAVPIARDDLVPADEFVRVQREEDSEQPDLPDAESVEGAEGAQRLTGAGGARAVRGAPRGGADGPALA